MLLMRPGWWRAWRWVACCTPGRGGKPRPSTPTEILGMPSSRGPYHARVAGSDLHAGVFVLIYQGAFAPHARIRRDAVAGARAAAGVAPVTTATAGPAPGGLAAAETATMWYPPGSWTVQAAKRSLYSFGVR